MSSLCRRRVSVVIPPVTKGLLFQWALEVCIHEYTKLWWIELITLFNFWVDFPSNGSLEIYVWSSYFFLNIRGGKCDLSSNVAAHLYFIFLAAQNGHIPDFIAFAFGAWPLANNCARFSPMAPCQLDGSLLSRARLFWRTVFFLLRLDYGNNRLLGHSPGLCAD